MAYTLNPKLPRLRAQAVDMVREGKTVTEVARHFGYSKGAVSKWCKKCPDNGSWVIPTRSSRPKSHPNQVSKEVVNKIRNIRVALGGRCAEVINKHLADDGIKLHRITVQRVLDRTGLTKKRSPWKRFHKSAERPEAAKPGDLVQIDTIHLMVNGKHRIYIYTLIDVYSRWTFAWATERINTRMSIKFLRLAEAKASFTFTCIQTDNGSEFSQHFTERIKITHRHSRIRKPNDNAHIERFNRTIQQELIRGLLINTKVINRFLPAYLDYYNNQRYHLGINLQTPAEVINRFQAIV